MPQEPQAYGGIDILEALLAAKRYNAHLVGRLIAAAEGKRRVVDFGAGFGTFAALLKAEGLQPLAVEPDAGNRLRIAANGIAAVADLSDIDGSVEFLYSLNVLEHIEDDIAALAQIHRKLSPDGRVFIYVPAFRALWTSLDDHVGHQRRYTLPELTAKMRRAGFAIEQARYVDCLGAPAALLFKLLRRSSTAINSRSVAAYDRILFPLSQALDPVLGRWFGKNVLVIGRKGYPQRSNT
jgi:SAM-dependent methyltransferase